MFFIFLALLLAVHLATLQDGHCWEFDDFGQYLAHARNLVEGRPYQDGIVLANTPASPAAYPPVYPLLLAPVWAAFGLNFIYLKAVNLLLLVLMAAPLFRLLRRELSRETALLFTMYCLSAPFFFIFKQRIYSDWAFWLFALWALVLFQGYLDRGGGRRLAVSLIFMSLAMLSRMAGLSLFAGAVLWLVLVRRNWKAALLCVTIPLALLLVGQLWLDTPVLGYLDQLPPWSHWAHGSLYNIIGTLWHLFEALAGGKLNPDTDGLLYFPPMVLVGVLLVWSVAYRFWRREPGFYLTFGLIYWLLNILWPFSPTTRSMVLLGFVLLPTIVQGIGLLLDRLGASRRGWRNKGLATVALAAMALNIVIIGLSFSQDENDTSRPETRQMLAWLKENTGQQEHYVNSANRVISLLTGRTGLALPPSRELLLRDMRQYGADRVILSLAQPEDRAARAWLADQPGFRLEWSKPDWEIYQRVRPSSEVIPPAVRYLLLRTGIPASQGTLVWQSPQP
jgi:4-amino-4-deoxy-L-arabinose transferase-like glycosyltransferase